MTRAVRFVVLAVGAVGLAVLLGAALRGMPEFGGLFHPYRDIAVSAALSRSTANAVSSVNFDLRALDTLGEELILLGSVAGAAALLRPARDEVQRATAKPARVLELTELAGYLLLPITLLVGVDILAHGHLTPGGGFQAGVVLATGLHLLYVSGDYRALQRLRPLSWYAEAEAFGAAAFVALGLGGVATGSAFLANVLPTGVLGEMFSAGTVPLLSAAIGCAVGAGIVVLLAQFLQQAIVIGPDPEPGGQQ
jgi:multicomponent Na+:H+ antiporter subunit B